jgi:hypothetical protein
MMDFRLIDVKSITSNVPRSQFDETELARLAEMILACEGLLKPPILKVTGLDSYAVIDGDREYYAATVAREMDPRQGEMIDALVISPKHEEMVRKQIDLLRSLEKPAVWSPPPLPSSSDQPPLVDLMQRQERSFHARMDSLNGKLEQVLDRTTALALEKIAEILHQEIQKVVEEKLLPQVAQAVQETVSQLDIVGRPRPASKPRVSTKLPEGLSDSQYAKMKVPELQELARQRGIYRSKARKPELVMLHEDFDARFQVKS